MTADGKPPMNYETYILPHQLPRVVPREGPVDPLPGNPDEEFFIRTHQALEIWFAQLLAEMAHARRLLAQPAPTYVPETDIPDIVKHIRRAARIFDLIGQHLPVLETLDTASFYNFRKHLFGASGTQSFRFREVEWLMGMLDTGLLRYTRQKPAGAGEEHSALAAYQAQWNARWDRRRKRFDPVDFPHMPETAAALARRMADIGDQGSLRSHAMNWLARTTFPATRGAPHARHSALFATRFEKAYMAAHAADMHRMADLQGMETADFARLTAEARRRTRHFFRQPNRRAIVFLLQFADQPLLTWPASFVEALLELEQAFANWRDRHIAMVARVLGGGRISTLGAAGSGLAYLRGTLPKRVFPEIWDARSFMLSRDEAAGLYTKRQLSSFGFK